MPSVLWRCWLGGRKGIRSVKNWVVGWWCGCLGWGADLHIAQKMPLPLTISCSSKSRLVLTFPVLPFWYLLTRVVLDIFQKSSKTVVCVCVHNVHNLWAKVTKYYYSCIFHVVIIYPAKLIVSSSTTVLIQDSFSSTAGSFLTQHITLDSLSWQTKK